MSTVARASRRPAHGIGGTIPRGFAPWRWRHIGTTKRAGWVYTSGGREYKGPDGWAFVPRQVDKGSRMKRLLLVVTSVVALVSIPGTASAQEYGCQAFGQLAAFEAQLETGIGEEVSAAAPANDDVFFLQDQACGA
jgi:hypothetical protein